MCENVLVDAKFAELDRFIESLEEKEGSLITVLHKAQELFGYLPKEVQLYVARKIDLPAAKVFGVVSFYSYFSEVPRGRHVINVCLGTACFVKGSLGILQEIEAHLGIKAGETTKDCKFSIDLLRCVGACGLAPVVMIDGKVYGRVARNSVINLIRSHTEV